MELQVIKELQQIDMFHGYCIRGTYTDYNNHHTVKEDYKIFLIGIDDQIRGSTNGFDDVVLHGLQFGVLSIAGSSGNVATCLLN
jgi:hypothetical protein